MQPKRKKPNKAERAEIILQEAENIMENFNKKQRVLDISMRFGIPVEYEELFESEMERLNIEVGKWWIHSNLGITPEVYLLSREQKPPL